MFVYLTPCSKEPRSLACAYVSERDILQILYCKCFAERSKERLPRGLIIV